LKVLQHGSAACYAEADPAIRSLAFIIYQAHSLNALTLLSSQPTLNMPNDLDEVPKPTYAEIVVKAGTPLVFSTRWTNGDGFRYHVATTFLSFTPATGADYEVVVTGNLRTSMRVSIAQLKVEDGKIERTPVDVKPLRICGTT
jgi:hypothetical protein